MPLAADLQNDGLLDIFFMTQTGIVFQYKTNSRVPKGAIIWGQHFGQNQNTVNQAYETPKTLTASITILMGLILCLTGSTTMFITHRNKRK
jgi:hypothetical protein